MTTPLQLRYSSSTRLYFPEEVGVASETREYMDGVEICLELCDQIAECCFASISYTSV